MKITANTAKIIGLTVFILLLSCVFSPEPKAGTIGISVGYSSGTSLGNSLYISSSYGYSSYGYSWYRPYYYRSYYNPTMYWGPRYYRPVRYPKPSYSQYRRDHDLCVALLEQKYSHYIALKQREKELAELVPLAPVEMEKEHDILLEIDENTEAPPLEDTDTPTPNEVQISDDGTVVIAMY